MKRPDLDKLLSRLLAVAAIIKTVLRDHPGWTARVAPFLGVLGHLVGMRSAALFDHGLSESLP